MLMRRYCGPTLNEELSSEPDTARGRGKTSKMQPWRPNDRQRGFGSILNEEGIRKSIPPGEPWQNVGSLTLDVEWSPKRVLEMYINICLQTKTVQNNQKQK